MPVNVHRDGVEEGDTKTFHIKLRQPHVYHDGDLEVGPGLLELCVELLVVVLFFVSTDCPTSNTFTPAMKDIAEAFGEDFAFFSIHSDTSVSDPDRATHAPMIEITHPVLKDGDQALARSSAPPSPPKRSSSTPKAPSSTRAASTTSISDRPRSSRKRRSLISRKRWRRSGRGKM